MTLYLQALEAVDAEAIAELAGREHGPELQPSVDELVQAFEAAQEEQGNFSLGLLDGTRLHGYLLAWLEESRLEGPPHSVVLVEDLLVDSLARAQLSMLLRVLVQNLDEAGLGHLPIESAVVRSRQATFEQLEDFIAQLGYELVGSHQYHDAELGEEVTWVRFERPATVEARINEEEAFVAAEEEFQ